MTEHGSTPPNNAVEQQNTDPIKPIEAVHQEKTEAQRAFETNLKVDLGSAGIIAFAPEGGWTLRNDHQLGRREELTIPYPAKIINEGNIDQVETQKKRESGIDPLQAPNFEFKVGVLNMHEEGNELVFDTKPQTFVMGDKHEFLGLQHPDNAGLRAEFGIPLSTAGIFFTTEEDGSSNMILQNRSGENASYKTMIGASVAATNEQRPAVDEDKTYTGALVPLDDDAGKQLILDELHEELGILPEDLAGGVDGIEWTGVGIDKRRVHLELLAMATINMTARQVFERADKNLAVDYGAFNFPEHVFIIPGTSETIRKVLNLDTPIPPTHITALLAAGRMLELKAHGEEAANEWVNVVSQEVIETDKRIQSRVTEFTNGEQQQYNPRKAPAEQGLQTAQEALDEANLVVHSN